MAAPRSSMVASDEKIAQTLQEEFDSEAAEEAANAAHGVCRGSIAGKAEVRDQAFRDLSVGSSALTELSRHSRVSNSAKKVSCSEASSSSLRHSPRKSTPTVQGDHQLALALSEDYPQVDKELARRLHNLDSIPHIPKVNGAIPPVEAANTDHQRLLDRLSLYGLAERRIAGDGNCQFRALSDQLYRSPEHHMFVRDKIVFQLTKSVDSYSGYVPLSYDEYLRKMTKDGEWGDHVTLQAAADYYGVKISLITSFKNTCFVEIIPSVQKSTREIYLSFWAEVHYNSLYPLGELPGALENWIEQYHGANSKVEDVSHVSTGSRMTRIREEQYSNIRKKLYECF